MFVLKCGIPVRRERLAMVFCYPGGLDLHRTLHPAMYCILPQKQR